MRTLKTRHLAVLAALGAAFAFFTSKSRASDEEPAQDEESITVDSRVSAFLNMIGVLETGSVDSYDVFYGGSRFSDFSNHPVLTGEKQGLPLTEKMCRDAGFSSGKCVSTAAGKYQINVPTFLEVLADHPDFTPDFSPSAQDEIAILILQKIGALNALLEDDFDTALRLASKRWASLPFSTANQNPKSYAYALSQYLDYLEA